MASEPSTSEKASGSRNKSGMPTSIRQLRNQAEKQRRDRLNGYISELATLVPMVYNATKPLDKVSILRLAAAQMRLNISCLNPKKYKSKPVTLPPSVLSYIDVIERSIGGFVLATTFSGCIVFCSKSIEDYVGYQNIDVMGNSVYSYIHSGDLNYFEKKFHSVTSSQKKSSKKKTKVIKVHMQQKPLPRSNDIRYRKMIFKISVHVNDLVDGDTNGTTQTPGKGKKTGRLKDFGTNAIVLLFVEPVRLEPEIDVTYIESHQDAYFTMHGIKGEIIYADQRISSITGYMPHDVQGKSAYQYICSSDVPIALFAQNDMFTSSDGTGVIVYRLRITDMRYIYLQSTGQIAYKDSTNEISHFVCFNKLLSDEEGSQLLKKFQERFAPQIMAAKMHQKKSNGEIHKQSSPLDPLEMIDSILAERQNQSAPLTKSSSLKDLLTKDISSLYKKNSSNNDNTKANNSALVSASVHSSDAHSFITPELSYENPSLHAQVYNSNHLTLQFEEQQPNQNLLLSDSSHFIDNSLQSQSTIPVTSESLNQNLTKNSNHKLLQITSYNNIETGIIGNEQDQLIVNNDLNKMQSLANAIFTPAINGFNKNLSGHKANDFEQVLAELSTSPISSDSNKIVRTEQNEPYIVDDFNTQMHSVNAFNSFSDGNIMNKDQAMDVSYKNEILQISTTYYGENTSNQTGSFINLNGHTSYAEMDLINLPNSMVNPLLPDQPEKLGEEYTSQRRMSNLSDSTNLSGVYTVSPKSSLSESQNSDIGMDSAFNYSPGVYSDNGSSSSGYMTGSVHSYNGSSNTDECNIIDGPHTYNNRNYEFTIPSTSADTSNFTGSENCDMLDISLFPQTSEKLAFKNMQNGEQLQYSKLRQGLNHSFTSRQNESLDLYASKVRPYMDFSDSNKIRDIGNVESTLNKELYNELDIFFQNLPQTEMMEESFAAEEPSKYIDTVNCLKNNISFRGQTNYRQ